MYEFREMSHFPSQHPWNCVTKVPVSLISFAAFGVGAYLVLVGALFLFQRSLLYHPGGPPPSPAASGVGEMRVVSLETEDGLQLAAWYASAPEGAPLVIYFCGNAGNIGGRAFKARRLLDSGFGVLLVSYRGYGGNPGQPTQDGLYADARAALRFAAGQGVTSRRIVLYGESLGTGVAVHAAAEQATTAPVAAVVLETPYTSIAEVATHHYPYLLAHWLVRDRFDAVSEIASIRAPLLVFHAENDRVIPIAISRRLFAAATAPKEARWFAAGGHGGLFDAGAGDTIVAFIRRIVGESR